jgi:Chaperone of endosialidase
LHRNLFWQRIERENETTRKRHKELFRGEEMNNQGINKSPNSLRRAFFLLVVLAAFGPVSLVRAQTSSFTYQGKLTEAGTAANATYDMQFKLFDSPTVGAGSQIGSTINNGTVPVNSGVFTVQLDFGAAAFSGADRYLEIGVRLAGDSSAYTLLSPRQQLTSAVYAIRAGSATSADNATQLAGVAAGQYVQTTDPRLTDARTPTAGSGNYIQNGSNQQTANFNISGNGTAGGGLSGNSVNSSTDYKIGGNSVLRVSGLGITNTFAGVGAGAVTTPSESGGNENSFFGVVAGNKNTTGASNSFFGSFAGASNITGNYNAFFGSSAGTANLAANNSFFGSLAGTANKSGESNSFFGAQSGKSNVNGDNNSFFGYSAGLSATGSNNTFLGTFAGMQDKTGFDNVFVGQFAGGPNVSGNRLTLIGSNAWVGSQNLINATAIGAFSIVNQSNSLVLGSIKNLNGAGFDTNVGIGTADPQSRLHIQVNNNGIHLGHLGCGSGFVGIGFGTSPSNCVDYSLLGNGTDTFVNRKSGGTLYFREGNQTQMSIAPGGALTIGGVVTLNTLASGGNIDFCLTASRQISSCGSSLRYKTNIQPFISGLSVLNRLRPITFDWKDGGMHDLGFGAEEIAAVEPLLVTHNDKGEVEGVKYDRITAVLVNAVKEQQEQIRQQQAQLKQQQQQIDSLRSLVARRHARASARRR